MPTEEALAAVELSLPMLGVGLALALLGWLLYWGGITAVGAVLGAAFGSGIGAFIVEIAKLEGTASMATIIGVAVLGAIVGAFALRIFHSVVFFLCGVVLGSLAVHHGLGAAQQLEWAWVDNGLVEIGLRAAGALIGGLLLAFLSKFIIVIVTSTLGTLLIVGAWPTPTMLLASIPIWVLSIILQFSIARKLNLFDKSYRKPEKKDRD